MPYYIVSVAFPYSDDLNKTKTRPAILVSQQFGQFDLCVLLFATSNLLAFDPDNDIKITDYDKLNLNKVTIIKPYKLASIPHSNITQIISTIEPDSQLHDDIQSKLKSIFQLQS